MLHNWLQAYPMDTQVIFSYGSVPDHWTDNTENGTRQLVLVLVLVLVLEGSWASR